MAGWPILRSQIWGPSKEKGGLETHVSHVGMLFYPYFLIIRILDLSGYLKKLSGYPSLAKLSTNLEKYRQHLHQIFINPQEFL